jgi:uncharacterized protein (DUF58 family)
MPTLTDPQFIRKLEMLSLLTRKTLGGSLKADRKSTKKGSGTTFADYSEYNLGDDYRSIDWNIYARLENLVIKLFEIEEDLHVYIFIDLSLSMSSKLDYARKLAAALSYIALNNLDRLTVYGLSDKLHTVLRPSHGRSHIFPMLESLQNAECYGHGTRFEQCIKSFQARGQRRGMCVLISDFFVRDGFEKALDLLSWRRHDVFCLQVNDPADEKCDWRGDIDFQCIETGRLKRVTVGPAEAARFTEAVHEWQRQLHKSCAKRGIGLARASIEVPFEEVIQNILRKGGLVA